MYTLLLILFLLASGGLLLLLKSNPGLKPAAAALPAAALLLFVFRPAPSGGGGYTPRFQHQLAARTGGQLAQALRPHLREQGTILVLHPEKSSPAFRQLRGERFLSGIEQAFRTDIRPIAYYPVPDTLYVDLATLREALRDRPDTAGIVLAGLQIMSDENLRAASLPPLVLSDLGDPATSEWALQNRVAVAALFIRNSDGPRPEPSSPEAYFDARFEILTASDLQ